MRDISRDQLARLETHKSMLAGVQRRGSLRTGTTCTATSPPTCSGYMNEVTAAELARDKSDIYQPGDLIGRFGVERMYEGHLRGVLGSRARRGRRQGAPKRDVGGR